MPHLEHVCAQAIARGREEDAFLLFLGVAHEQEGAGPEGHTDHERVVVRPTVR